MTIIRRAGDGGGRRRDASSRQVRSMAGTVRGRLTRRSDGRRREASRSGPGAADIHARQRAPKSFSGFDPTTMIGAAPESNEGAGPERRRRSIGKVAGRKRAATSPVTPSRRARAPSRKRAPRNSVFRLARSTARRGRWRARRDARRRSASALGYASAETGASPRSRRPRAFDASKHAAGSLAR